MQTRKALEALSKGERVYEDRINSPLLERSEQYLDQYNATEQRIAEQKTAGEVQMPFLETVRKRVSKLVSSPDQNIPVVGRFDLYAGVRKIAERAGKDSGLTRLATHLERVWQQDPLGTISYGQITALVQRYRDQYPRSRAADAIEAECARVGLHRLPVAKLARIAANIQTQEDYDVAMINNGFASDRPEHIRARAMVRALVSLRGADVDPRITQENETDLRSASERVSDKLAQMESLPTPPPPKKMGPPGAPGEPMEPEPPEELMVEPPDMAGPEMPAEEMAPAQNMLQEIEQVTQDIVDDAPQQDPAIETFIEHELGEGHHTEPIGGPSWGAEEVALEGHEGIPPDDVWMQEEMEEMGAPGAMPDMGLAPAGPPALPTSPPGVSPAAAPEEDLSHLNKLPPPGTPRITMRPRSIGKNPAVVKPQGPGPHTSEAPPGREDQVLELKKKFPGHPESAFAIAWDSYNKSHGKTSQRNFMVEREKNNLVRQKHLDTRRPNATPDMQTLLDMGYSPAEAMQLANMAKADPTNSLYDEFMVDSPRPMGAEKGIPLPDGKIDTQPNQDTPEQKKVHVPDGGGKALKASEIEDILLTGKGVKVGDLRIIINANDEVELWNREAGRACGIDHLDVAISDFMAMVKEAQNKVDASKVRFAFQFEQLTTVPCEKCGEMGVFPKAASADDAYECVCGHQILAGSVEELLRLAQSQQAYQLNVQYPLTQDPQKNKMQRDRVLGTLQKFVPNLQINDEGRGFFVATTWNADEHTVQVASKNLQAAGATPEIRRVGQLGQGQGIQAPAAPAAPTAPAVNPSAPISEIVQYALPHYKNMGMSFMKSVSQLQKDFKEREQEFEAPEADAAIRSMGEKLWGAAPAAAPAAPGAAAPGAAPSQPKMDAPGPVASKQAADSKMKTPEVRKPKDHVKVPADVGPDSETHEEIKTPGSVPTEHGVSGNPSKDKKLDPDSETKDLLPDPGKPKAEHPPKDQKGVSLPAKGLDKDHEPDDPFPTPAQGATPKVDKK